MVDSIKKITDRLKAEFVRLAVWVSIVRGA